MKYMKKIFILVILLLSFSFFEVYAENDSDNYYVTEEESNNETDSKKAALYAFLTFSLTIGLTVAFVFYKEKVKRKKLDHIKEELLIDQDELVKEYFSDLNEKKLLSILIDKYIEVQKAKMNFDYDTIERLCTKELYQSYKSDLDILKSKNRKNIVEDFDLVAYNIKDIKEENGIITIFIYLRVDFIDYVIDEKTLDIVRGFNDHRVANQYDVEFVISKDIIDKCPNCGALLDNNTCSHCNTYIDRGYSDFVMSSKKKIA